jgi:hypothetical protein
MKHTFRACVFAALACLGAVSVSANAAPLTSNFVDDNGKVAQLATPYAVEKGPGNVKVTAQNGSAYTFADATGAVYNRMYTYMANSGHYYQIAGTFKHVNTAQVTEISCYGATSMFGFPHGNYSVQVVDSCAAVAAVRSLSN